MKGRCSNRKVTLNGCPRSSLGRGIRLNLQVINLDDINAIIVEYRLKQNVYWALCGFWKLWLAVGTAAKEKKEEEGGDGGMVMVVVVVVIIMM